MTILVIMLVVLGVVDGTLDDDPYLDFTWEPASGNVDHYAVYVSINDGEFALVGTTRIPSIVYTHEPVGDKIILQVQAVDAEGPTGPMSEPSEPVWRVAQKEPPGKAISE